MPVTINGSGSIAGLNAGGLPSSALTGAIPTSIMPAGSVIQSVTATHSTISTNETTTYTDTGLTATISISANSKVLVLVTQQVEIKQTTTKVRGDIRIMRGSTEVYANSTHQGIMMENQTTETKYLAHYVSLSCLDTSPSTGSNTYKTQIRCHSAGNNARVRTSDNSIPATIVLMEIAG